MCAVEKVELSLEEKEEKKEVKLPKKEEKAQELTYARSKIFVRHIWGKFQQIRWIVFAFFSTIFFTLPWLQYDGKQAVLFDIPARKFHIFFVTLWPQEVYLLTLTLITAAIGLFFSTAVVGRVWCGYLCPQTVFTSVFIEIERFILGDRVAQIKLSKKPWNAEKILKLSLRNAIWIAIALFTGFTFLSYFMPNTEIISSILDGTLSGWSLFWMLFISGFALFDFGFFREQFCFVPCPYGRFQGALQDPNSLVVTYDKKKGEGDKAKGIKPACINCNLCVQVCPTGIDIRHGSQFECISCARCIDVCAVVQTNKGRSTDLIRYESENALKGLPTKILRPRLFVYSAIILTLLSYISIQVFTRPGFDLQIVRDRQLLFQVLPNGKVINMYSIQILNMSEKDEKYTLKIKDIKADLLTGQNPVTVKTGDAYVFNTSVTADKAQFGEAKVNKFSFVIERESQDGKIIEVSRGSTFVLP